MKTYHNQRQYSRSKVAIAATLIPENGEPSGVEVVDLSMGGIFLHTDRKLALGSRCRVSILLGHFKHELPIIADCIVVRVLKEGVALKFESVKLESIPNMQNLIVGHAEDPDRTQLELSSQGGFIFTPQ